MNQMETDLFSKKMEIAKRAGEVQTELTELSRVKDVVESKRKEVYRGGGRSSNEPIKILLGDRDVFSTSNWEVNGTALHDLVIQYLDTQINKRKAELDELIKVLQ